eukprot:gene422-1058_t
MNLYAFLSSPEGKAVLFYIDTIKINCNFVNLDDENKEEVFQDVLKKNPSGLLPFLEDSDVFISGSVPILVYLAEKYGRYALFGSKLETRAKVEAVLFWAVNSLARAVYHDFAAPRLYESHSIGEFEVISLIAHGKSEIINHFDTIEQHYLRNGKSNCLLGKELTMADILVATTVVPLEAVMFDFTPWPSLCKWFEMAKSTVAKARHNRKLSKEKQ